MKVKTRLCELVKGDLFETDNRINKVTQITDTEIIYYQWDFEWQQVISVRNKRGKHSQQIVYKLSEECIKEKERPFLKNTRNLLRTTYGNVIRARHIPALNEFNTTKI